MFIPKLITVIISISNITDVKGAARASLDRFSAGGFSSCRFLFRLLRGCLLR